MKILIKYQFVFTVAAVIGMMFMISCKQDKKAQFNTDEFIAKYQVIAPELLAQMKSVAKMGADTRGVETEDTATVMFQGARILKAEFERIDQLRVDTLMQGIKLFKASNWAESIISLNHYRNSYADPAFDNTMALFYLAKSKFNAGKYADAGNDYNEFINSKHDDKVLMQIAEWDRALCYMKIDETKVKSFLDNIAQNNDHAYQDDAKGLVQYFE